MMEGDISDVYVTQDEYEKYLSFNSYFNEDDNNSPNDSSSSQYRVFSDALQAELHRKYDLRPRTNVNTNKVNNQGQQDKIQNKDKGKKSQLQNKNLINKLQRKQMQNIKKQRKQAVLLT
jgi:hypothetical protein